jgi:hypothetical protein
MYSLSEIYSFLEILESYRRLSEDGFKQAGHHVRLICQLAEGIMNFATTQLFYEVLQIQSCAVDWSTSQCAPQSDMERHLSALAHSNFSEYMSSWRTC